MKFEKYTEENLNVKRFILQKEYEGIKNKMTREIDRLDEIEQEVLKIDQEIIKRVKNKPK
jgi:hypothetical protein